MVRPRRKLYFPEPPSAGGKDEFLARPGNNKHRIYEDWFWDGRLSFISLLFKTS